MSAPFAYQMEGEAMDWIAAFPRASRPVLQDIVTWLGPQAGPLFASFCAQLDDQFGIRPTRAWSKVHGWCYGFGYTGLLLFQGVRFVEGGFVVGDITVCDEETLAQAVAYVAALYADGYPQRLEAFQAARREKNAQKREASEPAAEKDSTLNRIKWPAKVSRKQLLQLYTTEAAGTPDEALVDDIGYTLYTRCRLAAEIWDIMERGAIRCLVCGAQLDIASLLDARHRKYLDWSQQPIACACGKRYTYRGYRQAYRTNNMPRGAASDVFDAFVADWARAASRGYREKMLLVDSLVHAAHVSLLGGTQGRPVAINLIEGNKAQILALLSQLAGNDAQI